MSRQRFLILVVAALVAAAGAWLLNARRTPLAETQGVALFAALLGSLNAVDSVVIHKGGGGTTTLQKSGGAWTVAERGGYPADVGKLRGLLTALGDAKIVEQKTSDPARYAVIGVEDPSQAGASGVEITVAEASAKQAVIVGKPVGGGTFVRRSGEAQSYSVEPAITAEPEPRGWIDSRLLDLPVTKIRSIEFKPASGPGYAVRRSNAADGTFNLEGVPAGRKPLDGNALAPSPTTFSNLTAEDVAALSAIDFGQSFVTVVTLTDGDVITLTGTVAGDKHWVQIKSAKQTALTAKTAGHAFELASYRYDALFKPLEQLLAPKDVPAKGGPAPKTGSQVPSAPHPSKKP